MVGSREQGRWWNPRKESGPFCLYHMQCECLDLGLHPQVPTGHEPLAEVRASRTPSASGSPPPRPFHFSSRGLCTAADPLPSLATPHCPAYPGAQLPDT